MKHRDIALTICIGILLAVIATLPLYSNVMNISNHADINRALVYSAIARSSIVAGNLPFWNQYICAGAPLWGDLESWFLQPFFILTLPFHEIVGLKLSYTLTLITAFVGFAIFAKKILKLRILGSLTFALVMAFSGYYSQHLAEGYYVWIAAAWIPWFLLCAVQSLKKQRYIPLAGCILAFMFGTGSMHMVVYSLLFAGLLFVFQKSKTPPYKKLVVLTSIVLFFVVFAAAKLLPSLSLLVSNQSREGFTPLPSLLVDMFFRRGSADALLYNGTLYRFGEFGNYIGYGTAILTLIGIFVIPKVLWRKYKAYLIASMIMLFIAFLPLPVTHGPVSHVIDLFRMPSRVMVFALIGIALLASYAMDTIRQYKKGIFITSAFFLIIACDLISNDYNLFQRTFTIPLPELHPEIKFMRVSNAYTSDHEIYYRAIYLDYLENRGTNDVCRFYQQPPRAHPIDSSDPRLVDTGEVYLRNTNAGSANVISRRNGEFAIRVNITAPTLLLVNQNYYDGWKTRENLLVVNTGGLIGIPVTPNIHDIHLHYKPEVVYWGIAISLIGIAVALLYVL